jgi:hypothetical protein
MPTDDLFEVRLIFRYTAGTTARPFFNVTARFIYLFITK